jgi:hypothetical protein
VPDIFDIHLADTVPDIFYIHLADTVPDIFDIHVADTVPDIFHFCCVETENDRHFNSIFLSLTSACIAIWSQYATVTINPTQPHTWCPEELTIGILL